jgi:hypothetical protein
MEFRMKLNLQNFLIYSVVSILLAACGGESSSPIPSQYFIGITVDNTTTPTRLYLADYNLNVIQSTSAVAGPVTLTTIAGLSGSAGATNGNGTAARFNGLEGIVIDSSGNLFAADSVNNGIRKITSPSSTAAVTTFAGTLGTSGMTDATGASALFYSPRGMAIDNSNNLFVTDAFNHTIRQITSSGVVTTIAGFAGTTGTADGTGSAARFNYPFAVAIDSATPQNLYVSDEANHAIRKLTFSGGAWTVSTLAGSIGTSGYTNGTGTNALFNFPLGIACDGTNVYVADAGNNAIRKIVIASGVVTTLAGSATGISGNANGTGTAATFSSPIGLSYGGGNLYVTDQNGSSIRVINTTTGAVTKLY